MWNLLFPIVGTYLVFGFATHITVDLYSDKVKELLRRGMPTMSPEEQEGFEDGYWRGATHPNSLLIGVLGWPIAIFMFFVLWRRVVKAESLGRFEQEQLEGGIFSGMGDGDWIERKPFRTVGGALILDYSEEIDAVHDVFAEMSEEDQEFYSGFLEKLKGVFVDQPGVMMGVHFERSTLDEGSATFSMKSFKGCGALMCHLYFRRATVISSAASYEVERFVELRASFAKMPESEEQDTLGTMSVYYHEPVEADERWRGIPEQEDLSGFEEDLALDLRMRILGKLNEGLPEDADEATDEATDETTDEATDEDAN